VERDEAEEIGLRDYLDPEGVTAVEWASKLGPGAATFTLTVGIEIAGGDRRILRITAEGSRGEDLLRRLGGT
jgi:tRNA A37 threonylcarbamoyladenosine biosynthesis protein TsaE